MIEKIKNLIKRHRMKKFLEGEGAKLFKPFGRCCPESIKCNLCDEGRHHGYSGTSGKKL